ncbi:MAG TPA: hypothetical protein VGO73_02095 [Pyrinomonadaceae bacterium]|jgi:hypothetical protein|nr:hypothetical protein [Pyrinomonadaceae bacterium]
MTASKNKWAIRIGSGIVVVAAIVGVVAIVRAPVILVGVAVVAFLIFLALKIHANRRAKVIFGFYVVSNEILIDGERSRYHFEIAQVIKIGEKVIRSMPDSPPLSRFALGALYHSIGDHNAAVEQLGFAAEEEVLKESRHVLPSRQLRHYVKRLRHIERRPKRYAKINAAIASLERMHQERAARLLAESQQQLRRMVEAYEVEMSEQIRSPRRDLPISNQRSLKSITAPPTISEVLNDIYQEEPEAS